MKEDEGASASSLIIPTPTPPEKDCCANCLFWDGDKDKQNGEESGQGVCREDSPRVFMLLVPKGPPDALISAAGQKKQEIEVRFPSAWPCVAGDKWCGRHKRLEAEDDS